MKKISLIFLILIAGLGMGFSSSSYFASAYALDSAISSGETMTIYGFIEHNAGQSTPLGVSELKIKYFKEGSDPSGAVSITSIQYISHYSNPENLLIKGAYAASFTVPSLSDGKYTARVLIGSEVVAQTSFNVDSSMDRDSKLYLTDLTEFAGSLNAQYKIENGNLTENITYTVAFESPRMSSAGSQLYNGQLFVQNESSNATSASITSPFVQGANIFIARVSATAAQSGNALASSMPISVLRLVSSGQAPSVERAGEIAISNCEAKENEQSICEFSVKNTGLYPTAYEFEISSELTANVEFGSSILNPEQSATGRIIVEGKYADIGSNALSLKLKHSGSILDSKSIIVNVLLHDLVNRIELRITELERFIIEGESSSLSFSASNNGEVDKKIRIVYSINSGTEQYFGPLFSLNKGQSASKTIESLPISGLIGNVAIEIKAISEEGSILGSIATGINVEKTNYAPFVSWSNSVIRIESGNYSQNTLTIRNNGNVDDTYIVVVESEFATLTRSVSLAPGSQESITVPVLGNAEKGTRQISAKACSIYDEACESANFSLIIFELPTFGNAQINASESKEMLQKDEAGIFEITVKNNNGDARKYEISVLGFEGEARVAPESKYVLSGAEETFLVYLMPESFESQNVEYLILESGTKISEGNLSLSYKGSGMLTGFASLTGASGILASAAGLALLGALGFFGAKALKQSKTELKYWK